MTLQSIATAKKDKLNRTHGDSFLSSSRHAALFHWLINSDMPTSELADERLAKEAQVILAAGSTSTARTLSHIVYYILANEHILLRLEKELREIMKGWPSTVPTWVELEGLPYLQALIKEGLRLDLSWEAPVNNLR